MCILALDGGGTAAKAVVFTNDGTALAAGRGGPCNFAVDPERAAVSIRQAGEAALAACSRSWADVTITVAGVSGAGRRAEQRQLETMLHSLGRVMVTHDGHVAMLGALAGSPGAAVVSGTGSVAMGQAVPGRTARAGGYGYILGDEGSAFAMAVAAIARVLQSEDGRQPPDPELRQAVLDCYQLTHVDDLIPFVYKQPLDRGRTASLTPRLEQLALGGHAYAQTIFFEAGQHLAALVVAVLRQLDLLQSPCRAAYLGGSFRSGELLVRPLTERILQQAPQCRVGPPLLPAVAGAFFLAQPHLQGNPAVIQRLQTTLQRLGTC